MVRKYKKGNSYKRGYSFERGLRMYLEKRGYLVVRSGKSRKPDLVAIPGHHGHSLYDGFGYSTQPLIIECKKDGHLDSVEWEYYTTLSKNRAGIVVICTKPFHRNEGAYRFRLFSKHGSIINDIRVDKSGRIIS